MLKIHFLWRVSWVDVYLFEGGTNLREKMQKRNEFNGQVPFRELVRKSNLFNKHGLGSRILTSDTQYELALVLSKVWHLFT